MRFLQSSSANSSLTSTGGNTPHSMLEKLLGSPKKAGSPRKPGGGSPSKSPEKGRNPRFPKSQEQSNTEKVTTKGNKICVLIVADTYYFAPIFTSLTFFCIFVLFSVDPKLGPQRKTAGVRNLPKIDRNAGAAGKVPSKRQQGKASKAFSGKVDFESNGKVEFWKINDIKIVMVLAIL